MDDFNTRLDSFRKELKDLCKKYYIVLDSGHIDYIDGRHLNYIICRDGTKRSDWRLLEEK